MAPYEKNQTYTTTEAAQIVGLAPRTVRKWIQSGRVTAAGRDRLGYLLDARGLEALRTAAAEPVKRGWPKGKPIPQDVLDKRAATRRANSTKQ